MQREIRKKTAVYGIIAVLLATILGAVCFNFGIRPLLRARASSTSYAYVPPIIGSSAPMPVLFSGKVLVYAYSDGDFVQASVTISGPESPNPYLNKPVNVTTLNGTTSTDLQNPLVFDWMWPGVYSVLGTYGSAPPQNETVNVPSGSYCDVLLNFGSVPLPSLGHIFVTAWYTGNKSSDNSQTTLVQASVTIVGPESHNGTTNHSFWSPLMFTVAPGEYSVFGTYKSWPQQMQTVNVTAASGVAAVFIFGDQPFIPPP